MLGSGIFPKLCFREIPVSVWKRGSDHISLKGRKVCVIPILLIDPSLTQCLLHSTEETMHLRFYHTASSIRPRYVRTSTRDRKI
jgi:hypothetical protein